VHISISRFFYPNFWSGFAWCSVDVFRAGNQVLVVLRDWDDHGGTSVTNNLEEVARKVRAEVLEVKGLERCTPHWIHWSKIDGIISQVSFTDPVNLAGPRWRYMPPAELSKTLNAFGAKGVFEQWEHQGMEMRDLRRSR